MTYLNQSVRRMSHIWAPWVAALHSTSTKSNPFWLSSMLI